MNISLKIKTLPVEPNFEKHAIGNAQLF